MARSTPKSASARSELRKFEDTKVTRGGFDRDTDQEFEAKRDARLGGGRFVNFEDKSETTTYSVAKLYGAYKERGEVVKSLIDNLRPDQLEQYKEFRKIAVKAYNNADEKLKADFKSRNPDKEYNGVQRGKIVANALKESRNAVQEKQPLQLFELDLIENLKPPQLASLAITRLTYEKDDFLKARGYYSGLPQGTHLEVDLIDGNEIDYLESKKK